MFSMLINLLLLLLLLLLYHHSQLRLYFIWHLYFMLLLYYTITCMKPLLYCTTLLHHYFTWHLYIRLLLNFTTILLLLYYWCMHSDLDLQGDMTHTEETWLTHKRHDLYRGDMTHTEETWLIETFEAASSRHCVCLHVHPHHRLLFQRWWPRLLHLFIQT